MAVFWGEEGLTWQPLAAGFLPPWLPEQRKRYCFEYKPKQLQKILDSDCLCSSNLLSTITIAFRQLSTMPFFFFFKSTLIVTMLKHLQFISLYLWCSHSPPFSLHPSFPDNNIWSYPLTFNNFPVTSSFQWIVSSISDLQVACCSIIQR